MFAKKIYYTDQKVLIVLHDCIYFVKVNLSVTNRERDREREREKEREQKIKFLFNYI